MKTIEYRAKVDLDDMLPLEAHEYARRDLRMKILNDQDYQLEILRGVSDIKNYVESQIKYQEAELKQWQKTPFYVQWVTGDNVMNKIETCHEVLINLKSILAYITHNEEAWNYQLKQKAKNN